MGIVIRPKEGDEVATHVTWVGQVNLKGWMPKMMVNKVTVGYPVSLYDDINTVKFMKIACRDLLHTTLLLMVTTIYGNIAQQPIKIKYSTEVTIDG